MSNRCLCSVYMTSVVPHTVMVLPYIDIVNYSKEHERQTQAKWAESMQNFSTSNKSKGSTLLMCMQCQLVFNTSPNLGQSSRLEMLNS